MRRNMLSPCHCGHMGSAHSQESKQYIMAHHAEMYKGLPQHDNDLYDAKANEHTDNIITTDNGDRIAVNIFDSFGEHFWAEPDHRGPLADCLGMNEGIISFFVFRKAFYSMDGWDL